MRFTHLHVASSYSMRYGTTAPADLVAYAKELGYQQLALTDRDGLYGAVRFVEACRRQGLSPIVGVDLALAAERARPEASGHTTSSRLSPARRNPVKGGFAVDDRGPRVTVLARGSAGGLTPGRGWAQLCRLVSEAHLTGERGKAEISKEQLATYAADQSAKSQSAQTGEFYRAGYATLHAVSALTVLLGPQSDVGLSLLARRYEQALRQAQAWQRALPHGALVIEVVCHDGPPGTTASRKHALDLWKLAKRLGIPAVLSGWVRHAHPEEAMIADILDASRRMVALNARHLDRVTLSGQLYPESHMLEVALQLATVLGEPSEAMTLIHATNALADACVQNPIADIGIGAIHLPEANVLGLEGQDPQQVLTQRCRSMLASRYGHLGEKTYEAAQHRLDTELDTIRQLGYPTYFLTVETVCNLMKDAGVRVAARGSGAGSLVNYLLGISGVDPIRYNLLMERFCTPMRVELPDIDIDVESARRTEMYERIMERFGGERVTCVSMMETYRVRHAIRDAGAALGMPPADVDVIAKAFPHIAAKDARKAVSDLPELRARGLAAAELNQLFDIVERLDGLPRHIAMHPCGVILSNSSLGDHTPMEASRLGFPMSQFDKDDVELLGFLKLDVLGIRMQSAMAHAVHEVERVEGVRIDLDDRDCLPLDDAKTFELIQSTRTLGCFQIESPGQRELIGKLEPREFDDLIIDISLFRPGPVKSDMITPFLRARHGWDEPEYLHPTLEPALAETNGVVVFHEQVLRIVAETTGVSLAQADEVRRAMGSPSGQERIEGWWRSAAAVRGYDATDRDRIWSVLAAFASFGFCKAHAAAFALPTYQSAWLKTHHIAAFIAGVLTHDPGMYPKRLILADARTFEVPILGVDVNASRAEYRVEKVGTQLGVRVGFMDVKGMSQTEVASLIAAAPYTNLSDVWNRAGLSRPTLENLIAVGALDSLYASGNTPRTRRDLLLDLEDLHHWSGKPRSAMRRNTKGGKGTHHSASASARSTPDSTMTFDPATFDPVRFDPVVSAQRQAQSPRPSQQLHEVGAQLTLDLTDTLTNGASSGLPEFTLAEKVRAELDILGLDVSSHVMDFYRPLLMALGATPASALAHEPGNTQVWCAGIKVATQTPPVRSGRRVIFLTVDDGTGPADATFFEDVQGPYAETVFHSWMLLVRGVVRRTGPRGVSMRATGAWDLAALWEVWQRGGITAVQAEITAAQQRHEDAHGVGTDGRRRVLKHLSGFTQSPYADTRPPGESLIGARAQLPGTGNAPRELWHTSPGSSGGWG